MSTPALPATLLRIKRACGRSFAMVGLFSAAINVLMLTSSIYMLLIYDRVLTSRSWDTLIYLTLIATVAIVVMGALEALRGQIVARISSFLEESVGREALERVAEASVNGRPYRTEALRDLAAVRQFMGSPAVFALFDTPWVPVYLAVMFVMHAVVGALATAGALALLGLAMIGSFLTRRGLRDGGALQIKTMQRVESIARNAEAVDAMGMLPALRQRWLKDTRHAIDVTEGASDRAGYVAAAVKTLRLMLQILILAVGAWLVVGQELTGGAMVAGSILMGRALAPVEQLVGAWKQLVATRESYARLVAFFAAPATRYEAMPLPAPRGRLTAEQVTYLPPGAEAPILHNASFTLEPGETLAIVGPSAAGKSTLARLVVGVLNPRVGRVRLDGADVFMWNREQFGRHVGYLPQDVELFAGTVAENIARFDGDWPKEVVRAAQLAGVHEMILRLPAGYETQIGEGGAKLSSGQRQRIGLARALFGDPALVVLDEPNSNLDSEGELALAGAIKELSRQGTTAVVVTHRPNLLSVIDKMLMLRDGAVVSFGPRDSVLARLNAQRRTEANAPPADAGVVRPMKRTAEASP